MIATHKTVLIVLLSIVGMHSWGQKKLLDDVAKRKVIIETDSLVSEIEIDYYESIKTSMSKTYHWYDKNTIHQTVGGYEGSLLDGKYIAWDLENNLREKGWYKKGLPVNEHYQWYPNGQLKEIYTWKKGVLHGPFQHYNEEGTLIKKGSYKKGSLNGKVTYFHEDGSTSIVSYCCGNKKETCQKKEQEKKSCSEKKRKKTHEKD